MSSQTFVPGNFVKIPLRSEHRTLHCQPESGSFRRYNLLVSPGQWYEKSTILFFLLPGTVASEPQFREETILDFTHQGSPTRAKFLPESMGGGVALFDYDGDGLLDIFLTNGAELDSGTKTWPKKRSPEFADRLFRNLGNRRFADVTEQAGITGTRYSTGVAAADYDNDGHIDLFVAGLGGNTLYRNNGNGTFTNVTAKARVAGSGWTSSAGWADLNADGFLDLIAVRYLDWTFDKNLWCGPKTLRAYCHPREFGPTTHLAFRNRGDGTFADSSDEWGFRSRPGKGLGIAFADFDGDGRIDIAIANDSYPQQIFFDRDGRFLDEAVFRGAAYDDDGLTFSGMGIDAGDYDGDGKFDLVINSLAMERYALFRNLGNSFEYASSRAGVGAATRTHSGWGMRFLDFDNDGDLDLFAAQGHVMDTIEVTNPQLRYREPPLLLRNDGGRFHLVEADRLSALGKAYAGRASAFGDLDNDGGIDVVISCLNAPPVVLFNRGPRGNYVMLRLRGRVSNRDGIGAVVRIEADGRRQVATVTQAGSYQSSNDIRVHFGLGKSDRVSRIEIAWPSGISQVLEDVPANQILEVSEPSDGLRRLRIPREP